MKTAHANFCRRNKSFQAPSELLDAFIEGAVVIFAGAGISTESRGVMPNTFYTEINYALGNTNSDRAFPDLMGDFCSTPAGKIGLIQRIRDHFDYAYEHSSIYADATRFHEELATFYAVDTLVTPIGMTISSGIVPPRRLLKIGILPSGLSHNAKSSRSMAQYPITDR
jgi:hypothetical protein